MSYRDSASFGKRREYIAIAELLKRNFDVYMTLVDDQGIDCIVRLDSSRYVDIQIKARSEMAKQTHLFAGMKVDPRDNLFFLLHTALYPDDYWVFPSLHLSQLCSVNKSGKNKGKFSLAFPKVVGTAKYNRFEIYRGDRGFELLRQWRPGTN